MVPLDHLAELGRDPLGQMRRDAASDANDLDVRDRAQALEEILQPAVRQHHRVAAAQDDIADLGVRPQVGEGRVVLIEGDLLRIADFAASRAEPAIRRADRADEKQRAVWIPVRDVGHRRVRVLVERVDDAVDDLQLREPSARIAATWRPRRGSARGPPGVMRIWNESNAGRSASTSMTSGPKRSASCSSVATLCLKDLLPFTHAGPPLRTRRGAWKRLAYTMRSSPAA